MSSERLFFALAALLGGTAVAAGAFATHALRPQLTPRLLEVFETGVRYQMYHALALGIVALALTTSLGQATWLTAGGWALVIGTVIFSGSLYALSLSGIGILGAVAPLGGLALMVGWGCLAIAAYLGSSALS
ncbi:DUF423 domain-containing protein [Leptolyngbya sp. BL0902]|uniref:DUF423 domain-containing protein n=1 Tax=Leptolyngbya sp. BL0902 TaxID=1115757 RepID=UPI0018E6E1E2|nr:DUF423 domain-containing protein [Leptolyngbya sp. BL0902]QQE63421.1 DUF423 domain-containing protein [Leptolyngbya sp. BL0902]